MFTPGPVPGGHFERIVVMQPKIELGVIVMTSGVAEWIDPTEDDGVINIKVGECLYRHACGDWGDVDDEDREVNDRGVDPLHPTRLVSSYDIDGTTIWIITERDRSSTTLLFPSEY